MQASTASSSTRAGPVRRQNGQHQPILGTEIRLRHALNVSRGDVLENVELAIGCTDVVVEDRRMSQLQRLVLIGFAIA